MSVTAARGFRAAGVAAGLKSTGARDVALVVSDGPLDVAAAVFTSNRVQAAPVQWSRQAVADGRARAVILNSGGANACTGPEGFADSHRTAEHVADALEMSAQDVLVCSTGLIGVRLPMDSLLAGADAARAALADTEAAGLEAELYIPSTQFLNPRLGKRTLAASYMLSRLLHMNPQWRRCCLWLGTANLTQVRRFVRHALIY